MSGGCAVLSVIAWLANKQAFAQCYVQQCRFRILGFWQLLLLPPARLYMYCLFTADTNRHSSHSPSTCLPGSSTVPLSVEAISSAVVLCHSTAALTARTKSDSASSATMSRSTSSVSDEDPEEVSVSASLCFCFCFCFLADSGGSRCWWAGLQAPGASRPSADHVF